jgi:hypothetical protein
MAADCSSVPNAIYHGGRLDRLVCSDGTVVVADLTDGQVVSAQQLMKVFAGTLADTDVELRTGHRHVSGRDGPQHHELFEGVTADGGQRGPGGPCWLRGTQTASQRYDLEVVGIVLNHDALDTCRSARAGSVHESVHVREDSIGP